MRLSRRLRLIVRCGFLTAACLTSSNAAATIYRCEANGVLTYSDRPCDADATVHELDATQLNTFEAPAITTKTPTTREPKTRKSKSTPQQDPSKHAQECERLVGAQKYVRSKMRAGYSASEGERLKEREAKLKSQLRLAKCR